MCVEGVVDVSGRRHTYRQLFLQAVVEVFGLVGLQLLQGDSSFSDEFVVAELILVADGDPADGGREREESGGTGGGTGGGSGAAPDGSLLTQASRRRSPKPGAARPSEWRRPWTGGAGEPVDLMEEAPQTLGGFQVSPQSDAALTRLT